MSTHIRPLVGADEVNAAFGVFRRAMIGLGFGDLDATQTTESGRYLGAFDSRGADGDQLVGTADSYTSQLVVPGGTRVPHAAVTHIGVLPTHRRRGIVSALIDEQFRDFASRGEVVATLRASEATIYERFGYGVAGSARSVTVDVHHSELRASAPIGGEIRIVDDAVTSELLEDMYRRASWVGAIDRPAGWWRFQEIRRSWDSATYYVVVHSSDGVDDGYVIYRPENPETWFGSREKAVTIIDFFADGDAARAGLWRHLFNLDLVDVITWPAVALDDPLPLALTDRRAVRLGPAYDETWLRLIDVERALDMRTYAESDPVTISVVDDQIESNNGSFEIGPKGVHRTDSAPDVTVDVATLAATYLGGTRWAQLASVGRVDVHSDTAITCLDVLFITAREPFSGTMF